MVEQRSPKPRAEGSSPSAPAKNREASTMLASLFFVSAHKDSATRHGCALRSACRGVSERQWRSAAPVSAAPATKPAETLGFCRFSFCMYCMAMVFTLVRTSGFLIWFYPSSTVLIPSSTRNAPDFGCFRLKSGAFRCFCPLLTCKILGLVFVHCADISHRLKPSVIPCRREVSFLT